MKTIYAALLALVLIVGCAKVLSGHAAADMPTRVHDHPQPPPLLEMLPPIGPLGILLMGVIMEEGMFFGEKAGPNDWNPGQDDNLTAHGHDPDHDGHHHEGESRSVSGAADRETETTDAGQTAEPTRPISSHKLKVLHTAINPSNNHTYHLLEQSTWTAASAEAEKLGGHLVTVRNQSENNWIFNTFSNWGGRSRDLWLGYNDILTEGAFVWSNGEEASYSNWSALNPDNNTDTESSGEDYVHMYGHGSQYGPGKWNDMFDARYADWSRGYYGVAEVPAK